MKIGVPREIKVKEGRVALTPAGVSLLVLNGHRVYVEKDAGGGSAISNEEYINSGAIILNSPEEVWAEGEMIIKVKEPIESEFSYMREGQIIFTYLHLASDIVLTEKLLEKKVTAIAYETMQGEDGSLPLLAPMSEVAGKLSVQMGCHCLEAGNGGRGVLLSGVPGVAPANTLVIGGGVSGFNAAKMASAMGSRVTVMDLNLNRLRYIDNYFGSCITTILSGPLNIERAIKDADLVIGAVLIPGAAAPRVITRKMTGTMKAGSAFVDIAIDQGGCSETSRPTTHEEPIFIDNGVVHYCVANMPGAVPLTSTYALTNATLPYAVKIAGAGYRRAAAEDSLIAGGINVSAGELNCRSVAESLGMKYTKLRLSQ